MSLLTDIDQQISSYLAGNYSITKAQDVPVPERVPLGNHASVLYAATLFIDIRQSSSITTSFRRQTAAKMSKAYFAGAVKIVNVNHGFVRSFNGDGMLAIFKTGDPAVNAVKASLQIQYFVQQILEPRFRRYFVNNLSSLGKALNFSVGSGIDIGQIYAVKVGIQGTNDVAWIGRCTNSCAKLASMASPNYTAITHEAYKKLDNSVVLSLSGQNMWNHYVTVNLGGEDRNITTTNYYWPII